MFQEFFRRGTVGAVQLKAEIDGIYDYALEICVTGGCNI